MRTLALMTTFLFLFTSGYSYASKEESNCVSPLNQIEINMCAKSRYDNAAHKMNTLYDSKLSILTKASRERLRFAQEAWIIFRERSCIYESSGVDGGSGWQMMYNTCMAHMTEKRVAELQGYADCTENGCPD
jgi:uncharacterized protein YecT (DUF1311 family)